LLLTHNGATLSQTLLWSSTQIFTLQFHDNIFNPQVAKGTDKSVNEYSRVLLSKKPNFAGKVSRFSLIIES
jgi:hypothetical protein